MAWSIQKALLTVISFAAAVESVSFAAPIQSQSILVTCQNLVFEYTRAGEFIQGFPVPHPISSAYFATGTAVNADGSVVVRNVAFDSFDFFSRLDSTTGTWSHTLANAIEFSNGSHADLSALGTIAVTNGVVLDMQTWETRQVPALGIYGEVSWGLDGLLYAMETDFSSSLVRVLDPGDFSVIRHFTLPVDGRGIAVDRSGDIFVGDNNGEIYHFSAAGILQENAPSGIQLLTGIKLHPDGTLIVGSGSGNVAIMDTSLDSAHTFSAGFGPAYVAFAEPVPEPSSCMLSIAAMGSMILIGCKTCRKRRAEAKARS